MLIASFIIGISLFLSSICITRTSCIYVSQKLNVSNLKVGLPMATSIAITHGFLPPHPGPVAIAQAVHANIGHVLMYGIIIGIPLAIIVGGLFPKIAYKLAPTAFSKTGKRDDIEGTKSLLLEQQPSFGISLLTALSPVILMLLSTIVQLVTGHEDGKASGFEGFIYFIVHLLLRC